MVAKGGPCTVARISNMASVKRPHFLLLAFRSCGGTIPKPCNKHIAVARYSECSGKNWMRAQRIIRIVSKLCEKQPIPSTPSLSVSINFLLNTPIRKMAENCTRNLFTLISKGQNTFMVQCDLCYSFLSINRMQL